MESRGGREEERKGECRCAEGKGRGQEERGDAEGGNFYPRHWQPRAVCPPAPREPPACIARAGGGADRRELPDGAGGGHRKTGLCAHPPDVRRLGTALPLPRLRPGAPGVCAALPGGDRCAWETARLWGRRGRVEGVQQDPEKPVT